MLATQEGLNVVGFVFFFIPYPFASSVEVQGAILAG